MKKPAVQGNLNGGFPFIRRKDFPVWIIWPPHCIFPPIASCSAASASRTACAIARQCERSRAFGGSAQPGITQVYQLIEGTQIKTGRRKFTLGYWQ